MHRHTKTQQKTLFASTVWIMKQTNICKHPEKIKSMCCYRTLIEKVFYNTLKKKKSVL
jgi:hypothetical protein